VSSRESETSTTVPLSISTLSSFDSTSPFYSTSLDLTLYYSLSPRRRLFDFDSLRLSSNLFLLINLEQRRYELMETFEREGSR